jgi:hypothetical protein
LRAARDVRQAAEEASGNLSGQGTPDLHLTSIGHSYGATTAGIAAADVRVGVVDDLVLTGAPGIGVDDVAQYNITGQVFVSSADGDVVPGIGPDGGFGIGPQGAPGVISLPTNPKPPIEQASDIVVEWVVGQHQGYFDKDSDSSKAIGTVVGGDTPS